VHQIKFKSAFELPLFPQKKNAFFQMFQQTCNGVGLVPFSIDGTRVQLTAALQFSMRFLILLRMNRGRNNIFAECSVLPFRSERLKNVG
jgi:hypothetical protein